MSKTPETMNGAESVVRSLHEGVATEVTDNPVEKVFSAMWQPRYPRIAVV